MREIVRFFLKYQLYVVLVFLFATRVLVAIGYGDEPRLLVVLLLASLGVYSMGHAFLRRIAFTVWVFAFVAVSMFYPAAFMTWRGLDLKLLMVPLIQIIMFGMGTTLSMQDLTRVFVMPWPVFVGIVLQFGVMPFAGWGIAKLFGFEAEVAAGVILIGSVPGGVASNVMTYLARGNVALSVTMTACSTLLSPIMTPFMMKMLAGEKVDIVFLEWMLEIVNIIIVPIVAGLLAHRILYGRAPRLNRAGSLALIGTFGILAALVVALLARHYSPSPPASITENSSAESAAGAEDSQEAQIKERAQSRISLLPLTSGLIIGFGLVGVVALSKLAVRVMLHGPEDWMDKVLPIVSMIGICFIIAIITARSQQKLLTVGLALVGAAMIHNSVGYVLGYWLARLARLNQTACRTVAIEVGLQNGGMASTLAMKLLTANAALAPAIFGPWMNISGSMLATWWHSRPVRDGSAVEKMHEPTP